MKQYTSAKHSEKVVGIKELIHQLLTLTF